MPFTCSICGEESTHICVRCTKDSCDNHLCEKCHKCSDCCECEVSLTPSVHETVREVVHPVVAEDATPDDGGLNSTPEEEPPAEEAAPLVEVSPIVEEAPAPSQPAVEEPPLPDTPAEPTSDVG